LALLLFACGSDSDDDNQGAAGRQNVYAVQVKSLNIVNADTGQPVAAKIEKIKGRVTIE
jgi:hypothetical protein